MKEKETPQKTRIERRTEENQKTKIARRRKRRKHGNYEGEERSN